MKLLKIRFNQYNDALIIGCGCEIVSVEGSVCSDVSAVNDTAERPFLLGIFRPADEPTSPEPNTKTQRLCAMAD